jgi:SAM-dependent methyltransferase
MFKCEICGSLKKVRYASLGARLFGAQYEIFLCAGCGIGKTVPQPSKEIADYVESDRPDAISEATLHSAHSAVGEIIKEFRSLYGRPPNSIVDVGCGNGLMLLAAKEQGLRTHGVEPSRSMCFNSRSKGLSVSECGLEDFSDYGNFDIVMFNSVLEHLPDPSFVLKFLSNQTFGETMLVFQQATYDGLIPRLFRHLWYGWAPHEHFWHFSESSFRRLLLANNLLCKSTLRTNLYYHFLPLSAIVHWKSFFLTTVMKVFSIVAHIVRRGDSVTFFVMRKDPHST